MDSVIERLDPEAVAGGEQGVVLIVPQHERELAAQLLQAMSAEFLVQMQRDLAVRARAEHVSAPLQFPALAVKVIKLAVDNDLNPSVLVGDRLTTGCEINDGKSRVTKTDTLIGG